MNSKSKKKAPAKNVEVESTPTNLTESEVLAMRKAQAKELAAKKSRDFSLEDELHDIKNTLLDTDEPAALINAQGEVVKLPEDDTPKTTLEEDVPVKPKKKVTKRSETKPVVTSDEPLPFAKSTTQLEPEEKPQEDNEGKGIIDNLQKLRDQINAQKALEREMMKKEASKVQDKDKKIMTKLNALEQLVKQSDSVIDKDPYELENQNRKLSKQLNDANQKIQDLQKEFDRLQSEPNIANRSELEKTLRQYEETYNNKISELEKLITEQQEQIDERIRLEQAKQQALQGEIDRLQLEAKNVTKPSSTPKELETIQKQLEKNFQNEKVKIEKELAQKEKQQAKELEALAKKNEKTLLQEKDKSEKKLLKKQEEFFAKLDKQKEQYEQKLTAEKDRTKEALREERTRLEELYKNADNEQLIKVTNDYETRLQEKDGIILALQNQNNDLMQSKEESIQTLKSEYEIKMVELNESFVHEKALLEEEHNKAFDTFRHQMQKELDDARYLNEVQKQNLMDSEIKISEQAAHYQKLIEEERAKNRTTGQDAAKNVANRSEMFAEEIKAFKQESEAKLATIREQYQEAIASMDNYKRELDKTREQLEKVQQGTAEEKNRHQELERKLARELDDRNQEIKQLKANFDQLVKEKEAAKLETQLNQIATMVTELGNKSKEGPNHPYQYNYEYEKEMERRKRITEAMMKEEEEQERRKQDELKQSFNIKIEGLESQVRELGSLLKVKVEDNSEQTKIIKSITDDFEAFKKELKDDLEQQRKAKEEESAAPMRKLVQEYTRDKDLLQYQHNNEINNLEVDKKFVTDSEIIKTIDEKIRQARVRYLEMAQHRDIQFQRDLAILNGYQIPIEPIRYVEPKKEEIPVGDAPSTHEVTTEQLVMEELPPQELPPQELPPQELPPQELPIRESEEEKLAPVEEPIPTPDLTSTPKRSTVVYTRPIDTDTFVRSIDQEYLRRLSNIKQMKTLLDARKKELTSSYEVDRAELRDQEARLVQKVEDVNRKIEALKLEYENKAMNTRNQSSFETENTKLNVELLSRKEQLRKIHEEDMVKLNSRYQNAMMNIDHQYQGLVEEEQTLKEEHVIKQQKLQSRIVREEAMVKKLQEEQTEGRIIESQEEIKQRTLATPEPTPTEKAPVAPATVEPTPTEPVAVTPSEPSAAISPKEKELRVIYQKYVDAQRKLLQDFVSVRDYQESLKEKLGYKLQNDRLNQQIADLELQAKAPMSASDKSRLDWQLKDLLIRRDNNKTKIAYRDRQLASLTSNKHVADYVKIIDRLETMTQILKQYAAKRG